MPKIDKKRKREVPETEQTVNLLTPSEEGKGNKRNKVSSTPNPTEKSKKTPKAGPSNSHRVGGSSGAKTVLVTEEVVKFLEKKHLDRKHEPLSLEHIVGEIKKGKGVNFKLFKSLGETLSSHPRVLVSSTLRGDTFYAYKPVYDFNDHESLLLKLRNTGGLFLEDIKSSLPNAENVLSKLVGKSILYLPGKHDKETVVYYNIESEVGKMDLDDDTKHLWRRLGGPGFDDNKVVEFLKKNSLTFLEHEIAANHVPASLKQLARLLAVTLNTREEALVVDRIVHFGCVWEESLEIICHFKGNQLKGILAKLVSERILQVGHSEESELKFYYISYHKLFNLVRYKLEKIRKKVAQNKDPHPNYFCPTCKKEFTYFDVFNAAKLQNNPSGLFCAACKICIEDITDIKETRMEIFQRNMQHLYKLLQEAESMELVPSVRPPQPANASRFKRDQGHLIILSESEEEDDGPDELTCSGLEGAAVSVIMGVGIPAKQVLGTKEVPALFKKSTVFEEENVDGQSTADGKPKKVYRPDKENIQVAACAVELMYQAETYNLGAKVEVMDSDSSEDKDDDSVDPKHGDESVENED